MDHIEADEFDYYLTDEDYATISEKLKDDIYDMFMGGEMEGFLEDHELTYDDITTIMSKLCTDLTEIKRPAYNIIIK